MEGLRLGCPRCRPTSGPRSAPFTGSPSITPGESKSVAFRVGEPARRRGLDYLGYRRIPPTRRHRRPPRGTDSRAIFQLSGDAQRESTKSTCSEHSPLQDGGEPGQREEVSVPGRGSALYSPSEKKRELAQPEEGNHPSEGIYFAQLPSSTSSPTTSRPLFSSCFYCMKNLQFLHLAL